MSTIRNQLSSYLAYHRDRRNRATHFVGIPLVVLAVLIATSWFRFVVPGVPISLATVLLGGSLFYYWRLDRVIAVVVGLVSIPTLFLAEHISSWPFGESATAFAVVFIAGWAFQLLGHHFEGRKPAFTDDLLQLWNGPLMLAAEVAVFLKLRNEWRSLFEKSP